MSKLSLTDRILIYETEETSEEFMLALFQELVDTGLAWELQGSYGRMAAALIEQGLIDDRRGAAPDLLAALKYARRFLTAPDHDVAFVDAAIKRAQEVRP